MNTEPGEREEAPERIFLKACHPASPNHNCTWSMSKTQEDSVEYVRADLPGSQVAGGDTGLLKEVVARIERQIRLWNNDTVTMACADMLADIKQLPLSNAATRMRERCVTRVKELAADYYALSLSEWFHKYEEERLEKVVITALESLTLDEEK